MDWIERYLHVSPDHGSGAAEIAIYAGLVFLLLLAVYSLVRRFTDYRLPRIVRRRTRSSDPSPGQADPAER